MKHFLCAALAIVSAVSAAGAMAARAAEIELVAPTNGATVSLLSPSQKLWREATRESRNEFLVGKTPQMRKISRKPCPVRLEWTGSGETFNVRVAKRGSGDTWFQAEVRTNVVEVWNLEVARIYDWEVRGGGNCAKGSFRTEDAAPRVIVIPKSDGSVRDRNMRDIGGIVVAGRRVKQGMVFRSGSLNDNAKQENGKPVAAGSHVLTKDGLSYMRDRLGIKTDLDLRTDWECFGMTGSPLGEGVAWTHIPATAYSRMFGSRGKAACGKCLRLFLDEANYPIDIHCHGGVDRTASLVVILQGILGFPEDEIWQDYQFSSSKSGFSPKAGSKCLQTFSKFLKGFDQYDGTTLDERIRKYVVDLGFTEADIEKLRTILLEEK